MVVDFSCVVTPSTRKITVTFDQVTYSYLGFKIGNINNPDSALTTGKFVININDPQGTLIDSSKTLDLTIEPAILDTVTLVNTNKTVGGYGKLQVALTTLT